MRKPSARDRYEDQQSMMERARERSQTSHGRRFGHSSSRLNRDGHGLNSTVNPRLGRSVLVRDDVVDFDGPAALFGNYVELTQFLLRIMLTFVVVPRLVLVYFSKPRILAVVTLLHSSTAIREC